MKPVNVLKATRDDWYPSLEAGNTGTKFVELQFGYDELDRIYYIVVGYFDNFGLSKHFESEAEGWCCFLELIGKDYVDVEETREMGFSDDSQYLTL